MMKKQQIFGIILFVSLFISILGILTHNGTAHNPSNMSLTYNEVTNQLDVSITHSVSDPTTHYIESISIEVNGTEVINEQYTSQPSTTTFSYTYDVTANEGATIQVSISCNLSGGLSRSLNVEENGNNTPSNISGFSLLILFLIMISMGSYIVYNAKFKK